MFFSCSKTSETPLARVGSSVLYEKDLVNNHGYKIKTKEKAYDFIETLSYEKLGASKVNYLCLMMIDSIIHYHVFPRFSKELIIENDILKDEYFPKPVDLLDGWHMNIEIIKNRGRWEVFRKSKSK